MVGNLMQDLTPALLDIKEAAAFLRVSETSLRRWTNAGRLPCLRIGGRAERRFRQSDLEAFLGMTHQESSRPPRRHFCGLYSSDLSRTRAAAAFLTAPIPADARCFLVAHPDVRRAVISEIERQRGSVGPSIRHDITVGRLVLTGYQRSVPRQLSYWREQMQDALAAGIARMTVVGDVSGGPLGTLPVAEVLEYEIEYDRSVGRPFPVTTLCQYDARTLSGVDAAGVLQCHDGTERTYHCEH